MKVFEIDGYWIDDEEHFSNYIVAEFDSIPDGYHEDNIFWYGITPVVGESYDNEFTVTAVREVV